MISVQPIAQGAQHPAGTTVAPLWLVVRIMLMEERFSALLYKRRSLPENLSPAEKDFSE
ncbi:MAG: hypothetical protein J6X71_03780 [Bacteroidales bacterium]|nr:hypothetical protein [Bacteroidales bacterium]